MYETSFPELLSPPGHLLPHKFFPGVAVVGQEVREYQVGGVVLGVGREGVGERGDVGPGQPTETEFLPYTTQAGRWLVMPGQAVGDI